MINNIEENIKDFSRNIQNKMKDIVGKKKLSNQFEVEAWTSSVQWDN